MKQFTIPAGMRDQILGECEIKNQLRLKIEHCLDKWGYQEIITPTIEYYKTYEEGFMGIEEKDAYKFFDDNGRIVMLRADMTIPIARVVATKFKDVSLPLRFRYYANVFKVHERFSGNRNETSECGVELIGMEETCGDLEILVTALDTLKVITDKTFILEIGNINFFNKACEVANIQNSQKEQLANLINSKSMKALKDMLDGLDVDEKIRTFFYKLPWLNGDVRILEEAKQYIFDDSLEAILLYMKQLNGDLMALGYNEMQYDLSKAGNLNYYTGIIFDGFVEGVGKRVLSGGRYDTLIARFGKAMPATGFAIKLDALLECTKNETKKVGYTIYYASKDRIQALLEAKKLQEKASVYLCVDENSENIWIHKEE